MQWHVGGKTMKQSKQLIFIISGITALALATLACGSIRFGVVTPAPEDLVDPASENLDKGTNEEPTETVEMEPVENPVSETDTDDTPEGSTKIPVTAWLGHIASMPDGSQYDDFLILSPEGTGEFGLTGATPEIEAEIRTLRDAEGPREYVHLWGKLACGVDDYNDCQLLVDRTQYGANTSEEAISGWVGTIKSSTFNSGTSFVFELDGLYPMWYSIYASQDEGLNAEIENLRDTGAIVRVNGTLIVGIPDVNGTRIEVSSLEILVEGTATQPELDDSIDPTADWPVFVNDRYNYQFRYPIEATISFHGPAGFPSEDLPDGMTADQYLDELTKTYTDRLCVGIHYSLGVIYISAPPNTGVFYTPCGPTGVGSGEVINKVENVVVGDTLYQASGMEILLEVSDGVGGVMRGETLDMHSEMFYVTLEDDTRIFFGSIPVHDATYEDYLMKTREFLLQILRTYEDLD
jgi:hypothetical protein